MASKQGKLVQQTNIPVEAGKPSEESAKKWLGEQIPYRNFAGVIEELDQKAAAFVMAHRDRFRNRMAGPMKRWAMNWSTANTEALWQEHEDDVHIPETKKALDSKVARVEEAITQFDPVFECEGVRGDLSRTKAKVIGSYVYRQMELANWQDLIQPTARDGELCNISAIKIAWEHRSELIVDRDIELRHTKNEEPYYHDERRMRRAVAKSGVRYSLVDPFWFIYDIDAPSVQECAFIGDESLVFLHDLEADAKQGIFPQKQIDLLRKRAMSGTSTRVADNTARAEWADQHRQARSIAMGPMLSGDTQTQHGARRIRCIEMWAWFDFGEGFDGVIDPLGQKLKGAHRVVITYAEGVIIRFQLNPFDRKFVPYAVMRINRNGHEMVAPAPFDSVVQTNAHYDRLSSNIMRWMDLAVSPIVMLSDANADVPDSILEVQPGTILRGVGDWNWIKVPDITQSVSYFQNFFRREVEENSGALRVFESPQGTATETERKVQEQQRMVRSSIRANAELWRQVALLTYWMSAQFATGPERFAVAGKASSMLGRFATITPDILQEEADFRFLALTNLHTFGNRLQGMAQWMNRWGPMLQQMPNVNLNRLCQLDFELAVGKASTDEIFPSNDPAWESWPQEDENVMILSGHPVSVHPADDDEDHLMKVATIIANKNVPKYIKALAAEHAEMHMRQLRQKAAQQKAQQAEAQQRGALMAPTGGEPGVEAPPAAGGMPAVRDKGITPGPPQARTASRTGRSGSGLSQTQAMA